MPGAEHPFQPFRDQDLKLLFARAASERAVALAVSGGSDSMALLHLAKRWAGARQLTVLTVDHGLRPESAGEAQQVARWAATLGLVHVTLTWSGEKPQTGIQAKAREARYRLMRNWCEGQNVRVLMTAHTLDDQAETVLMRMVRGTSIEGLAAMAPEMALPLGVKLLRPLLSVSRERLRAFLLSFGQAWIEDPSNIDERFERVRVRKALPALAQAGLTIETLADVAARAREAHLALQHATTEIVERHSRHHKEGYAEFSREAFEVLPHELKLRVLDWHIRRYGGGRRPERSELVLLAGELCLPEAAARHTLGGAIIARRRREILIGREPARIDPAPAALVNGMIWDRRFQIFAPRAEGLTVAPATGAASRREHDDLPDFVRRSLPAIFEGEKLVAIPSLGTGAPNFTAEFRGPEAPEPS